MNWGLFLALMGFLLPFAHVMRQAVMLIIERGGEPTVAAARWIMLLLLAIPVTGKLPAMLYAVTGEFGSMSQLAEAFLVTSWGIAHLWATAVAVVAIDLLGGGVIARLAGKPAPSRGEAWRTLARDVMLATWLLMLAWAAAR